MNEINLQIERMKSLLIQERRENADLKKENQKLKRENQKLYQQQTNLLGTIQKLSLSGGKS